MPKALKIVAAVMVALASATIGWFGVKWYQDSRPAAAPSPSASPTPTTTAVAYVHLTFNLDEVSSQVTDLIPHPQCGDKWSEDAAVVNGVKLSADADVKTVSGADHLTMTSGFTPAGQEPVAFLGAEGDYIVTRDGVVVSPDWSAEYVPQYYVAAPGSVTPAGDGVTLTGPTLCDVADQLGAIWADVDFATATRRGHRGRAGKDRRLQRGPRRSARQASTRSTPWHPWCLVRPRRSPGRSARRASTTSAPSRTRLATPRWARTPASSNTARTRPMPTGTLLPATATCRKTCSPKCSLETCQRSTSLTGRQRSRFPSQWLSLFRRARAGAGLAPRPPRAQHLLLHPEPARGRDRVTQHQHREAHHREPPKIVHVPVGELPVGQQLH